MKKFMKKNFKTHVSQLPISFLLLSDIEIARVIGNDSNNFMPRLEHEIKKNFNLKGFVK